MATLTLTLFTNLLLFFFSLSPIQSQSTTSPRSTFIVYVSKSHKPVGFSSTHDWHSSLLHSLSATPPPDLLYSYTHSASGFSAVLTAAQVSELRRHPAVLSVIPDQVHHLHTTRTPHFLNLSQGYGLWPQSNYASDIIIGVLDTGIWPEIRSFSDYGYEPVPSTWKGMCEVGPDFPASCCNRKLIGARAFYKGYEAAEGPIDQRKESKSPRDTQGHGTHTASTAAGSVVPNAGFYEYAKGTAWGMATMARIAAYKMCWKMGCYDTDQLAAIDQAIEDGVHVISISVGARGDAPPYNQDPVAVGALHAVQSGVLVSCSAGNSGPGYYTAVNVAPWILTVGASTIDRDFPANVVLGDGRSFYGVSLYAGDTFNTYLQLVYAGHYGTQFCDQGKLDASKVVGKIVICDQGGNISGTAKGAVVKQAGGLGMILANIAGYGEIVRAEPHLLPATAVGQIAGDQIKYYVSSSRNPIAIINFKGTVISNSPPAPMVASFSSRGPNRLTIEIIKPDVIAPGVNILAGWTGAAGPTDLDIDPRRVEFNIISGTSMSCPHVSGLAALLKNAHPSWSPAAIKSALMTTAYNLDNSGNNITDLGFGIESNPFIHGSGHVDPNKALNPGLVYDLGISDYIAFLCGIGYDSKTVETFLKKPTTVDCTSQSLSNPGNLNYPSFSILFKPSKKVVTYTRKVTNVGRSANAIYTVTVNAPPNVKVSVSPTKLVFSAQKRTLSYNVTFTSTLEIDQSISGSTSYGSIEWIDGSRHRVRSPIAVIWPVTGTQQLPVASI